MPRLPLSHLKFNFTDKNRFISLLIHANFTDNLISQFLFRKADKLSCNQANLNWWLYHFCIKEI